MLTVIEFDIMMSDFCIDVLGNVIPTDEWFTEYKNYYDRIEITEDIKHLIPTRLIHYLEKLYNQTCTIHGEDETKILYTQILERINVLVYPINTNFFFKYISSFNPKEQNNLKTIKQRMKDAESCLSAEENIGNEIYSTEYYGQVLKLQLGEASIDVDKVQAISLILKNLIASRNTVKEVYFTEGL